MSYRSNVLKTGRVSQGDQPKSKHQIKAEKKALRSFNKRKATEARRAEANADRLVQTPKITQAQPVTTQAQPVDTQAQPVNAAATVAPQAPAEVPAVQEAALQPQANQAPAQAPRAGFFARFWSATKAAVSDSWSVVKAAATKSWNATKAAASRAYQGVVSVVTWPFPRTNRGE